MPSLKWFGGNSKEAMQQIVDRNCVFFVYIGKGNDYFTEVFDDPNIIQLLNNELLLCYKLDPESSSFTNFEGIFKNIVIPSVYLLEKSNIQQYVIKKQDLMMKSHEIHLDLKRQIFNSIHSIITCISGTINDENKQKYLQYLTDVTKELQVLDNPNINDGTQKIADAIKKSKDMAKIKIKVPCRDVTIVREFERTSSLDDVKTFVLENVNLPNGPIKFIAHRQFVDEDFCKTLDALNLCPSSTIYVHLIPANQWLTKFNYQSWFKKVYHYTIINPYKFIQHFLLSFIQRPTSIDVPRTSNRPNITYTKKKPVRKPISNIHQLRTKDSDDDENNTYNGNSTQQL